MAQSLQWLILYIRVSDVFDQFVAVYITSGFVVPGQSHWHPIDFGRLQRRYVFSSNSQPDCVAVDVAILIRVE